MPPVGHSWRAYTVRENELLKVGDLARRTGVTVRTLHHYDEIGLLAPSHRAGSGHRLYTPADLARLQQVLCLRQLGFALDEIRDCLTRPDFDPVTVLRLHVARVKEQLRAQQQVYARLEALADALGRADAVSADQFLLSIEATVMIEKYYTPDQLAELKDRRDAVGDGRVKEVESEWPGLMAAVQAEMDAGTDPADPKVQVLAAKWMGLVEEFTGGNPGIADSLRTLYQSEDRVAGMETGPMRVQQAYIQKALDAAKS